MGEDNVFISLACHLLLLFWHAKKNIIDSPTAIPDFYSIDPKAVLYRTECWNRHILKALGITFLCMEMMYCTSIDFQLSINNTTVPLIPITIPIDIIIIIIII